MKVISLSALCTGRLYSPGISINPRATVRQEALGKWRISMTPPRIELATFRLVAQCLNKLRHPVRQHPNSIGFKKEWLYASTPPPAFMACTQTAKRLSADTNLRFIFGNFPVLIQTNLQTAMTDISAVFSVSPAKFWIMSWYWLRPLPSKSSLMYHSRPIFWTDSYKLRNLKINNQLAILLIMAA